MPLAAGTAYTAGAMWNVSGVKSVDDSARARYGFSASPARYGFSVHGFLCGAVEVGGPAAGAAAEEGGTGSPGQEVGSSNSCPTQALASMSRCRPHEPGLGISTRVLAYSLFTQNATAVLCAIVSI